MIFIMNNKWSGQLHNLLSKSMIVYDTNKAQFINDRAEGKATAVDIVDGDNEILYFKKGKQTAQMVSYFTGYKIKPSRDKFLMNTLCPAIIIKSNNININDVAEALLEL